MNEKWKSPYTGAEDHDESTRIGAGKLACSKELSRFSGSGEPGVTQTDRREAEDTGYIKKPIDRKLYERTAPDGGDRYGDWIDTAESGE